MYVFIGQFDSRVCYSASSPYTSTYTSTASSTAATTITTSAATTERSMGKVIDRSSSIAIISGDLGNALKNEAKLGFL